MSEIINRLRELSVTLGRFRSDDEVDEALNDGADRIAALEAETAALREENDRLRKALEWCRDRDERNGSLPEAYAETIRAALEPRK